MLSCKLIDGSPVSRERLTSLEGRLSVNMLKGRSHCTLTGLYTPLRVFKPQPLTGCDKNKDTQTKCTQEIPELKADVS